MLSNGEFYREPGLDYYPASAVDGHMIASDLGRDLRRRC
jgi:hypothetical protein